MNVDLERAGKALPLAVAAIYLVGFLVVASHLAKYGTSSLELFKVQYLAAGFWCGFVFATYFGMLTGIRHSLRFEEQVPPRVGVIWSCVLPNGILIICMLAGFGFISYVPPTHPPLPSFWLLLLLLCWLALIDFVLGLQEVRQQPAVFRELFFGVLFMAYILLFSKAFYPYTSFNFGGGRPRSVVFVLNDGAGPTSPFLVRDGAGPRTIPYQLLLENENSFVVISPKAGEKAIEFDRKSVAAMIVLESPKKP